MKTLKMVHIKKTKKQTNRKQTLEPITQSEVNQKEKTYHN